MIGVDLATQGGHSFWPEIWLTDSPIPVPHGSHAGEDSPPANGVGLEFLNGCGTATFDANGVQTGDYSGITAPTVNFFANGSETDVNPNPSAPCLATGRDDPNAVVIQVSTSKLMVWITDKSTLGTDANGMQTMSFDGAQLVTDYTFPSTLPFTRGYWHLEHSQYNAAKGMVDYNTQHSCSCYSASQIAAENNHTFHWHSPGFDGPSVGADRAYEVADSLGQRTDGSTNVGYRITSSGMFICCAGGGSSSISSLSIPNVDTTGIQSAKVTMNLREDTGGADVQVRLNGNSPISLVLPASWESTASTTMIAAYASVPTSEVQNGTNTLVLTSSNGAVVANIDLEMTATTSAPPPPAYVQGKAAISSATSDSVTLPGNATSGDTLVVGIAYGKGTPTVSDNLGTTFTLIQKGQFNTNALYYGKLVTSGSDTIALSVPDGQYADLSVAEFSGLTPSLVGGTTSDTNAISANPIGGTVMPETGQLILSTVIDAAGAVSPNSGFSDGASHELTDAGISLVYAFSNGTSATPGWTSPSSAWWSVEQGVMK